MMRFGHGHSVVLGALLAVALLHGHYLWSLTAAFVVGVAVGRAWGLLGALLRRPWPVIVQRPRRPW